MTVSEPSSQVLFNALSLTTSAIAKFFLSFISEFKHTSPSAHELRLFLPLLFLCGTLTCPARLSSALRCTISAHLDAPPSVHSISIGHASATTAGAFFQVVVSKARGHSCSCLASSRFRYNTRTYQGLEFFQADRRCTFTFEPKTQPR